MILNRLLTTVEYRACNLYALWFLRTINIEDSQAADYTHVQYSYFVHAHVTVAAKSHLHVQCASVGLPKPSKPTPPCHHPRSRSLATYTLPTSRNQAVHQYLINSLQTTPTAPNHRQYRPPNPQTLPQQKPWHSGEMAMLIDSNYSNSSSNYYRKMSSENSKRSNTQASAYAVNAGTMALTGFHFSTSGGGAPAW